ncbi:50S ribosomal protein L37ae [Candidatus Woesearchaeota archaeon]|nr:50S ribosomal protein L37ae [Candidatus Woesearchaeota archaeon]
MVKIEKLGSVKRFGARYGSKPKHLFAKIEKEQRRKHKCPYCSYVQVKRIALGIWKCRKCNAKFTGSAYSPLKSADLIKFRAEKPLTEESAEPKLLETEESEKEEAA